MPGIRRTVGETSVKLVMDGIKNDSTNLKELSETGKAILVGGVYNLEAKVVKL